MLNKFLIWTMWAVILLTIGLVLAENLLKSLE
jgi:hypothetical protein